MFREMRRKKQQLSSDECIAVLCRGTSGVLALSGDEGYPYALPISYVYDNGKLYFHCAKTGHKIDAVMACNKASFCVIDQDQVIPEKYTTAYRSVIAFGSIRILENPDEMRSVIEKIAVKYFPAGSEKQHRQEIEKDWPRLCILEFSIHHMTGKEGLELLSQKQK